MVVRVEFPGPAHVLDTGFLEFEIERHSPCPGQEFDPLRFQLGRLSSVLECLFELPRRGSHLASREKHIGGIGVRPLALQVKQRSVRLLEVTRQAQYP